MRILMRGIKIGKKKGGGKVTLMDVFETKVEDDFWVNEPLLIAKIHLLGL